MLYLGCLFYDQSPSRNTPGVATVITFISPIASITHDYIRAYNGTIGELDFLLLDIFLLWMSIGISSLFHLSESYSLEEYAIS